MSMVAGRKKILSSDRYWDWGLGNGNRKVPPVPGDDSIISQATYQER